MRRIGSLLALLSWAVWIVGSPASAHAQDDGTFTVYGQVTNGTAGAAPPEGLRVQVVALSRERAEASWDAMVDDQGRYRVEGIASIPGVIFMAGVDYGGARYAESVELPGGADDLTLNRPRTVERNLTVYEPATTDPGLRFDQSAVVISQVDEAHQSLRILEIHTITNPTDRTFTPQAGGPGGPAGLLVFGLPPHAFDLSPDWGLDAARIVQIDRGFASLTPVLPGQSQIVFRYQVPYTDTVFPFQRNVRYPVAAFQVLTPMDGPRVESADLPTASTADIVGRQYRTLGGGPFAAGQAVRVAVAGLPVAGGPLANVPPVSVAVMGSALGITIVLMGWWQARRGPTDENLVERIVALDIEHEAGTIAEDEYRQTRQDLLARAANGVGAATET